MSSDFVLTASNQLAKECCRTANGTTKGPLSSGPLRPAPTEHSDGNAHHEIDAQTEPELSSRCPLRLLLLTPLHLEAGVTVGTARSLEGGRRTMVMAMPSWFDLEPEGWSHNQSPLPAASARLVNFAWFLPFESPLIRSVLSLWQH